MRSVARGHEDQWSSSAGEIIYTHSYKHTHTVTLVLSYFPTPSSDTAGRSGLYCAISNALEQCKAEGVVDVFQAVKGVRMQKPGAVTTQVSGHDYYRNHEIPY